MLFHDVHLLLLLICPRCTHSTLLARAIIAPFTFLSGSAPEVFFGPGPGRCNCTP